MTFPDLERITVDSAVMGGKPCIRGTRVTVGTILGLIASGADRVEVLRLYPYLESEDIAAALAYGAWRSEERALPMAGRSVKILIDMNLSPEWQAVFEGEGWQSRHWIEVGPVRPILRSWPGLGTRIT